MQPMYNTGDNERIEYSAAKSTNFRVFINEFPYISFYTTDIVVPGVNLAETRAAYKNAPTYLSDNIIDYDPLTIGFTVDEYYRSYREIYEWMLRHGNPRGEPLEPVEEVEVYIAALDNNKNLIVTFRYSNVRPQSLGAITFNSQDESNSQLTCDVTCRYDYMRMITSTHELPDNITQALGASLPK